MSSESKELHPSWQNMPSTSTNAPTTKTTAPSDQTPFGINRFILLGIVIFYTFCIGSHFFNWTPWEDILKTSGAFNQLCPTIEVCEAQEEKIASILPLTSVFMFSFTFLAGMVLDIVGPRFCCLFGNLLLISGWGLLALSSDSRNTISVGFALMGAGTDPAFFGTLSIANLFPGYGSTVISVLGGARSLSNVIPVIMKQINWQFPNFTFPYMAICFVLMYVLCFISVVLLIPALPYRPLLRDPSVTPSNPFDSEPTEEDKDVEQQAPTSLLRSPLIELKLQCFALLKGLKSPMYLPIVIVAIINMVRNNFYLASASKQLGDATQALTIINMLAFIPAPILGLVVDKFGPLNVIMGVNTANLLSYVTLLVGQFASSAILVAVMNYASTILAFPGIGFLLSQIYCYIAVVFPPEDLGKLAGFASFVAGLCALVVNPMYSWSSEAHSFWQMDSVNVAISVANFGFIGFLMFRLKSKVSRK